MQQAIREKENESYSFWAHDVYSQGFDMLPEQISQQLKVLLHSQSNLLPMNQVSRTEHVFAHPPFHFVLIPSPPMAKLTLTSELQCLCWATSSVLCNGEAALAEVNGRTATS